MVLGDAPGLLVGAVALGMVHGIEPGHGWPVAASYALDQTNKWLYGFTASLILGMGHLVSSLAMVGAFFYAKSYFNLVEINEPLVIPGGIHLGGPVSLVAGVLLIVLGIREYRHGHSHGTHDGHSQDTHDDGHAHSTHDDHPHSSDDEHSHGHDRHDHESTHAAQDHTDGAAHDHRHGTAHDHSHEATHDHSPAEEDRGLRSRLKGALPFSGTDSHSHAHGAPDNVDERGLLGIAWFAFLLGFAHEEEFEIIALCAGSTYCLELMSAYAITVIVGIVGLTMLLIAGYQHYEERVEQYTPYLPAFSAAVLCIMGLGFITGLL